MFNVRVLTHVVCDNEKKAKIRYLEKKIPGLEVITVFRDDKKCDAVEARGAILVDDYSENLRLWDDALGVAVKFSGRNKKNNYITINSLDKLIDIFPKLEALVKEKTC